MNKLILAKNRKVEFPKRIKLTEPDTLDNYIYNLDFEPGLITESGTNIDANLINLLQKNSVIDLKCDKVENTNISSNLEIEIDGLNEFSIFQGMKIILVMNKESLFSTPIHLSFIDNETEAGKYPVKFYNNGNLETLNNMPKGVYQLIFINDYFIVISSGGSNSSTSLSEKKVLLKDLFPFDPSFSNRSFNLSNISFEKSGIVSIDIIDYSSNRDQGIIKNICIPILLLENGYQTNLKIPNNNYGTCNLKLTLENGLTLQILNSMELHQRLFAISSIIQIF